MKKPILWGTMLVLLAVTGARGALYTFDSGSSVGGIPDGNPLGTVFRGTASEAGTVVGLTVGLNVSGGYNGNLYAYLVAPNGTMVVLLDRPGVSVSNPFGATGAGMNITLLDWESDHGSIQDETSGSVLSGSYNAAGSLVSFNGSAEAGNWSLYFADLTRGGGTSTLDSWSLDIISIPTPVPVPEPINVALGVFGGVLGSLAIVRRLIAKHRQDKTHNILP